MARCMSATREQSVIRTHARLPPSPPDPLAFYGAEAIAHKLAGLGVHPVHNVRTIDRTLARYGLVTSASWDWCRRGFSPPKPPVCRQNAMHQFDFIFWHYLGARRPVLVMNREVFTLERQPAVNVRGDGYNDLSQKKRWHRYRIRTLPYPMLRSYHSQMAYNTYFTCSLIHQRQLAPVNGAQAHAHHVPHPLPFGRAQN